MAENTASDGFVGVKSTAVSKASSSFSSEEYRQRFELSGVAFRLAPPHGGLLVGVVPLAGKPKNVKMMCYLDLKMR